ncbi:MAG: hypothetical protein IAE78_24840, partial [Myxococcus sp.]|nr:hypothetical protein [Myxococcus sp.]
MRNSRWLVAFGLSVFGACTCVAPREDLIYACEPDGSCLVPGRVCVQNRCVPMANGGGRAGGDAGGSAGGSAGGDAGGMAGGDAGGS